MSNTKTCHRWLAVINDHTGKSADRGGHPFDKVLSEDYSLLPPKT